MAVKICAKCLKKKDILLFSRMSKAKDGRSRWCKNCYREYERIAYLTSNRHREMRKRKAKKYYQENKKERIMGAVLRNRLVDKRKIYARICARDISIEGRCCQKCKSTNKVERHHADYMQPNRIIFLCKRCHSFLHRKFKSIEDIFINKK